MTRRLAATAIVAAALAVPLTHANAARCGEPLDTVGDNTPEPVRSLYLKVCGV